MKDVLKALQIGLPEALIIGFGLIMLYIFIPMFINGGSVYLVESNKAILIPEIIVGVGILSYGIFRVARLIKRGSKESG